MCCQLLGCPLNDEKYIGGFRQLIGSWNMVNNTGNGVDFNSTGTVTFLGDKNGSFQLVLPTAVKTGVNDYNPKTNTVNGTWASDGQSLVLVYQPFGQWVKMTLTKKGHNYMDLTDGNHNSIYLTRLVGLPSPR
jgi:hypothetical protein